MLEFSEIPGQWEPLPAWARYFTSLGQAWPLAHSGARRCFVSTPCDSSAAGLVALGAVVQRLCEEHAGDLAEHFTRIAKVARVNPMALVLRHRKRPRTRWIFHRWDQTGIWVQLRDVADPESQVITDINAATWYFDGEPQVEAPIGGELSHDALYTALACEPSRVWQQNLRRTDSLVVLAGRAMGRAATQEMLSTVRIRRAAGEGEAATIAQLLAIEGWQPGKVSRTRYFNPRAPDVGKQFDRPGRPPALVVADGPGSFEEVYRNTECAEADIVTIVPRTLNTSALEDIAEVISGMSQWYEADNALPANLPAPPPGVHVAILRRRS